MTHAETRLTWAVETCARLGLRLTPVRRAILECLAREERPAPLVALAASEGLRGRWSISTIYRSLVLLEAAGLVRSLGTSHRTAGFVLNLPGETRAFGICRCCGVVVPMAMEAGLHETLSRQATAAGFGPGPVDVALLGLCTLCASVQQRQSCPCKLAAVERRGQRRSRSPMAGSNESPDSHLRREPGPS